MWLDTTATSSIGRFSDRCRNARSFRQCAAVEPMTSVRTGRPTTSSDHSISKRRATGPIAASSSSRGVDAVTWTRMKNRPDNGSPNCCDSVMFPPCSASSPATACTIPGRSGQERVRTQWVESSESEDTRSESSGRADRLTRWAA